MSVRGPPLLRRRLITIMADLDDALDTCCLNGQRRRTRRLPANQTYMQVESDGPCASPTGDPRSGGAPVSHNGPFRRRRNAIDHLLRKGCLPQPLKGKTIAVLGYGSQGHAHSLNMRDSGLKVVVGQRAGSKNYDLAKQHGFNPLPISEAVGVPTWSS